MGRWDGKHEMLLSVARDVFSRLGFKKTTIEDIAERAGVAKSSVYYYFDSKEKVFSDVVAHESGLLMEALETAIQDATKPEDQFVAFVKTRFEYLSRLRNLYSVSQEVMREMFPLVQVERERFEENEILLLVAIIERGVSCGDFRQCDAHLLALTVIASLRGLTDNFVTHSKDHRFVNGMDGLLDLLLNGLKTSGGTRS